MAESISVKLEGFSELDEKLKNLPAAVQRRALPRAMKAGADIIRDEARDNAPVDPTSKHPGQLRRDIKTTVSLSVASKKDREFLEAAGEGEAPDAVIATVAVHGKSAPLAHLPEYGASAHPIKAKNKKVLANLRQDKVFGRAVKHPGAKAKPFMRPAFDTKSGAALTEIQRVLKQEIEQADFTQGVAGLAGITLED